MINAPGNAQPLMTSDGKNWICATGNGAQLFEDETGAIVDENGDTTDPMTGMSYTDEIAGPYILPSTPGAPLPKWWMYFWGTPCSGDVSGASVIENAPTASASPIGGRNLALLAAAAFVLAVFL